MHNQAVHSLYWAQIGFWANGTQQDLTETKTYFALPYPTEVIDIADNDRFDAIVGMDVLQKFDVRFERTGDFEVRLT